MRTGEIVRIDEQICRVDSVDRELIRIGGDFRNADAAEIVTVAELFEAAGHPVPGGRLVCYMLLAKTDSHQVTLGNRSWVSNQCGLRGYFVFLNGGWVREDTEEIDCIEVAANASIDLSRLPALDAWDALPEVIKAVVL